MVCGCVALYETFTYVESLLLVVVAMLREDIDDEDTWIDDPCSIY